MTGHIWECFSSLLNENNSLSIPSLGLPIVQFTAHNLREEVGTGESPGSPTSSQKPQPLSFQGRARGGIQP